MIHDQCISGGVPQFDASRASQLLRLGIAGPNRPIDDLIARLEQPDGWEWFATQLRTKELSVLADGTTPLDPVCLSGVKEVSKKWLGRPASVDERLRGILGYFLSVALAMKQHGTNISSRPIEDIYGVLSDLATAVPDPWQTLLGGVSLPGQSSAR